MTGIPSLRSLSSASGLPRLLSAALLCFAVCAGALPAARAQRLELYGGVAVNHLSQVPTGVITTANGSVTQYSDATPVGFHFGITYRLLQLRGVDLGLDLRGSRRPGLAGSFDDGLYGLRLAAHTPVLHVKPYALISAGLLSMRTANTSDAASGQQTTAGDFASHYSVFEAFGGLDVPVYRFVDVRVIEVGGGHSLADTPGTGLWTVNSGVVFHF